MENNSRKDYGSITCDIYRAVSEIIASTCEHSISIAEVKCIVPDGFVKIPSTVPKSKQLTSNTTDISDKIKDAFCAALPAALSALGLVFNAPTVAVVFMTGAGGVASSFIQRIGESKDITLSELHLENIDLEKLTADKISVKININQDRKQEILAEANRKLEKVCSEISVYEEKNNSKHDVELNQEFGEWVQKFLMYVDNNQDDRKLYNLRNALINCLASMNIHVYDEVLLRDDGMPDVPIQEYLYDKREDRTAEFKEITRPAVYSNRALLARGEIL